MPGEEFIFGIRASLVAASALRNVLRTCSVVTDLYVLKVNEVAQNPQSGVTRSDIVILGVRSTTLWEYRFPCQCEP